MSSEPLHSAFDVLSGRLQAELETQLASMRSAMDEADDRHREALVEAERAAAAEVEREWAARIEALPPEWASRLRATSADRSSAAAVAGPATLSPADLARAAGHRLASAIRTMSRASSLTGVLDALADGAAAEAPCAAVFIRSARPDDGSASLESWRLDGCHEQRQNPPADLLAEVVRTRRPVRTAPTPSAVESGADLSDRAARPVLPPSATHVIVPVLVGEQAVAILYAEGADVSASSEPLEILALHASACLSDLTARRTLQAIGAHRAANMPPGDPAATTGDHDDSARRYARLLVSEIKLYNEAAVRAGRERHDLLARLRPEIERARRLYEERVPDPRGDRALLFQQELVHTLAAGDPSLLGAPA